MNPNWDPLIKAIVPLSFMAIWALTSLFNRESKSRAATTATPRPSPGGSVTRPRPGDPTLRWSSANNQASSTRLSPPRSAPRPNDDDEIVILSSSSITRDRSKANQPSASGTTRRPSKGKPVVPERRVESSTPRKKLAGVTQNVNQHMTASTIEMTPLASMPSMTEMSPLGLSGTPSLPAAGPAGSPLGFAATILADPARIREVFLLNEIMLPPVSRRTRRGGPPLG